ncbi:thioredoxin domain-containing protein 12 [Anabrus simplex]|uniref:thioredoxin domain-containing protein 12 n=1 Tax=Anabrus simplex TaxID=316456 RepID=UPI0035A2EC39
MALITSRVLFVFLQFFLVFLQLQFVVSVTSETPAQYPSANDGRGFGRHFQWLDLEKGLEVAKTTRKPLMLIIHKSWCDSCKALKPKFSASDEIRTLSTHFIMVNAGDKEDPKEKKYAPDGEYIPRILFLSPDGDVKTEFYNESGNPSYKYFYSDTWSIIATMKKVAVSYKRKISKEIKESKEKSEL